MAEAENAQTRAYSGTRLRAPEEFTFEATDWPVYRKRFQAYIRLTSCKLLPSSEQIDLLLYTMGARAHDVYDTFSGDVLETSTLEEVIKLFDNYFKPHVNATFERGRFMDRDQLQGKTNEEYIRVMVKLLEQPLELCNSIGG